MTRTRDTILVAGPSASGKTQILNLIRDLLTQQNISFEPIPHSDSHTVLVRMQEDDQIGGYGHYHDWCKGEIGHIHNDGRPILPFTLCGNSIAYQMMVDFFYQLAKLPESGRIRFAEWAGGVNINPKSEPASGTDLSFSTIGRMLFQGLLPAEGLNRVLAVFHPATTIDFRFRLNTKRELPTNEQIKLGQASWPLSETAMQIFGEDDFQNVTLFLQKMRIPHIFTIENTNDKSLTEGLKRYLPQILSTWRGGESGALQRIER